MNSCIIIRGAHSTIGRSLPPTMRSRKEETTVYAKIDTEVMHHKV